MAPKKPLYNSALTRANNARDSILAPTGGVPEYDIMSLENPYASPEEIKERLLRKQGVPAIKEPENPNVNPEDLPSDLVAEIRGKGSVRLTPEEHAEMLRTNAFSKREKLAKAFANLPAASTPAVASTALATVPPATPPAAPLEDTVTPEAEPNAALINAIKSMGTPEAETTTAPTAPVQTTAPTTPTAPTQEDRLTQLARIISTTQTPQSPEAMRGAASQDALSKIQAAMYAGLTRTPVPQSVFTPFKGATEVDRLEQLYRASQILGKPGTAAEQVDPLLIADLQRQFPNAQLPSNMSLSQYREIANILNRERTEGGKNERFKEAREQTAKQHKDRIDLAKQKMDKQEWQFVTSEIGDKQKQVAAVQSAMPVMQEVVDNSLAAFNLPGGEALRALKLGQFTPEQEQMWNVVFEQLVSPARKDLFGATLTGNELAAFNVMVGLGPNASVGTKLNALRLLMKRMQGSLKGAFGGIQDTEAFQNYRNVTGDLTHLNPLWAEFDESLAEAAANAPKAGEAAAMAGERVTGAIKKAAKGAATTVESALGGQPTQPRVQGPAAPPPAPQTQVPASPGPDFKRAKLKDGRSGWYNPKTKEFIGD